MSLYCSSFATIIPRLFGTRRTTRYDDDAFFTLSHVDLVQSGSGSCSCSISPRSYNFSRHIGFVSKFDQPCSSPVMEEEEEHEKLLIFSEAEEYSKELYVAVRAVQMACSLCQKVQDNLISKTSTNHQVHSKDDNSPVTVADWSVQAIVSWILSECLGSENISIVAEEDVQTLSKANASELLEAVVRTVNECLAEAPQFGVPKPKSALGASQVLEIISRCNSIGGSTGRFWVLDPVDGTLGFVRGDQYAVALALIEDGEVVLGVLGCPNYPMRKEWLSYQHRYHRIVAKLTPPTSQSWNKGCVLYAKRGSGKSWMQPLVHVDKKFVWPNYAKQVSVSSIDNPALATFCEPVEKANSSHSFTEGLAQSVGLRKQPLRVYSMVKYAAIARGDAEVFMKFARAGYKEKVWDHAAGVIIIQEAGGIVTDAGGLPLDFSKGLYLEGLDRGIIACSGSILHKKIVDAVDASWGSSSL
ncbi:PAP-specific phosphatase HAL2-like [Lotus japonicus]|uniref:PAP-specific phosphatase HAL2-like n=1 Tax=Lotus japonicus TaxID=34305 RepID=UPI002586FEFA|nr:PAP-specific phosphatase HAL2-like [Lotus japonicus]